MQGLHTKLLMCQIRHFTFTVIRPTLWRQAAVCFDAPDIYLSVAPRLTQQTWIVNTEVNSLSVQWKHGYAVMTASLFTQKLFWLGAERVIKSEMCLSVPTINPNIVTGISQRQYITCQWPTFSQGNGSKDTMVNNVQHVTYNLFPANTIISINVTFMLPFWMTFH